MSIILELYSRMFTSIMQEHHMYRYVHTVVIKRSLLTKIVCCLNINSLVLHFT